MALEFIDITEPSTNITSNMQILSGKNIPDIKLFELVSANDFEIIVEQWAFSKIDKKYVFVKKTGGSGDQGRDIFCYSDKEKLNLDIYQCKHYKNKITPTDMYLEIGKLIYYTFKKEFISPKNYYIVSTKGCGANLTRLLESPDNLKKNLISNWNKHCSDNITAMTKIEMTKELKVYIESFDFSIIQEITPLKVLSEFEQTKYYSQWFGIKKFERQQPPRPTAEIHSKELTYVNKLYNAYGSVNKIKIADRTQLSQQHASHFEIQRKCFYSAEGLKQFSRDSLPSEETFQDLQEQIIDPVKSQLLTNSYKDGVDCLNSATTLAQTLVIGNNSLKDFVRTTDRIGILHQVANEDDNLNWVQQIAQ